MDKLTVLLNSYSSILNKYTDTTHFIARNISMSTPEKLNSIKIQTEISNFELNRLIMNFEEFMTNNLLSNELIRYLKFFKQTLPTHRSNRDSIVSDFTGSSSSSSESLSTLEEFNSLKNFMNSNFENIINLDDNPEARFIFNFRVKLDQKINLIRTHDFNLNPDEIGDLLENLDSNIDENNLGVFYIIPLFKLSKFYLNFIKINKHYISFYTPVFIIIIIVSLILYNNFYFCYTCDILFIFTSFYLNLIPI